MRRCLTCLLMTAFMLCGCASKYGSAQTNVQYYPACYQPIEDLRAGERSETGGTVAGGLIGALGGALVGLMASNGKWQGAAIGAAMGGAAGTMAGNAYARNQQQADNNRRMAAYLQNLEGDISNLDIAQAAAKTSLQCYDRQFAQLLAAIKNRQISREAAAARYAEISNGRGEAIYILGENVVNARSLDEQYENAFRAEEENLNRATAANVSPAQVKAARTGLSTAKNRKKALAGKTRELEQEKTRAQEASARQTREINEALGQLEDIKA